VSGFGEAARLSAELFALGRALPSIALAGLGLTNGRALSGPLYAQLSIADPCNQRCVMCPYHPPSESRADPDAFSGAAPGIMPLATFREVLRDLHMLGTRHVDFVGRGEPLLHPEFPTMLEEAVGLRFRVGLTTNGARLSAHAMTLARSGLAHVRVSLDAATAETYARVHVGETAETFDRVKDAIRALAAARRGAPAPHLSVSFTVLRQNVGELVGVVELVAALGADGVFFHHLLPGTPDANGATLDQAALEHVSTLVGQARDRAAPLGVETNLDSFERSRPPYRIEGVAPERAGPERPVPCYVGSYFTSVLGNGRVAPCCQSRASMGSLADASFRALWNGAAYRSFRETSQALPSTASTLLETSDCDRCYMRPHNLAIHRALHPFATSASSEPLIQPVELLRRRRVRDHR
jgi:MoaA/NifB/PqqE/SkfB family radical SAM enzyme